MTIMSAIQITLLGLGAAKLATEHTTIYIDAFVDHEDFPPFQTEKADILLFTHADSDHFSPRKTAQAARETGAMVVGPPSIAYPLLADEKLPPEQLRIVYPVHFKKPITEEIRGIPFKIYQTRHFLEWEPPHVSYLIELDGKRLYHTGDSAMIDQADPDLHQVDVLLYNLVSLNKDPVDIARLAEVKKTFQPRCLLPMHLIRCHWTFSPQEVKHEVTQRALTNVVVLENEYQTFEVE